MNRKTPEMVLEEIATTLGLEVKGPPFKTYPHVAFTEQLDSQIRADLLIRIEENKLSKERFIDIRVSWSEIPGSEPKYAKVIMGVIQRVLDMGSLAEQIAGDRIWSHARTTTNTLAEVIPLSKCRD